MSAVRGYADWKPRDETLYWVGIVAEVLKEYEEYLPISLRQIFYRLVAEHGFEKTEEAYNRLGTWIGRARRAQLLPFDAIRDDQGRAHAVQSYPDRAGFWAFVREHANAYRRDRMNGQEIRMEVWSEAGMTEQLARVAWRYGIPVYSSRGFASVTNSHAVAERALEFWGTTVLLHVGDHDPSGVSIYESLVKDAQSFLLQEREWEHGDISRDGILLAEMAEKAGPWIRPVRVAITEEQIEEHGIETAPPKKEDSRTKNWIGETAQAEALPPDLLQEILTEAIESRLDMDRYEEECGLEKPDEESIDGLLKQAEAG